jgi:hypothetical protein
MRAGLFVECQTMRLTLASKAGMSHLTALAQDIRKLAGAVLQVYKGIRDYRAGRYPHLPHVEARRVYLIIRGDKRDRHPRFLVREVGGHGEEALGVPQLLQRPLCRADRRFAGYLP